MVLKGVVLRDVLLGLGGPVKSVRGRIERHQKKPHEMYLSWSLSPQIMNREQQIHHKIAEIDWDQVDLQIHTFHTRPEFLQHKWISVALKRTENAEDGYFFLV